MSDWQEYAEALRKIAAARETAARRQDQLASERASRLAAATAAVSAVAKQRQRMEQRLAALDELTVSTDGPREAIEMAPVSSFDDVGRSIERLRGWLVEAAEGLAEARRRERRARDRLRNRLVGAGLVLLPLVLVVVVAMGGPWWLVLVALAALTASYKFIRRT